MAGLRVQRAGARSLVQDLGFRRARRFAVPGGGALDREALALLNILLGNPSGTAAIEVALTSPTLACEGAPVRVALSGSLRGRVRSGTLSRALAPWTATTLRPGEVLDLDPPERGGTGLVGLSGGPRLDTVLGSRSTFPRAGLGGLDGRTLREGDLLPCVPVRRELADMRLRFEPPEPGPIRVVIAQAEWFAPGSLARFVASEWKVSRQTDRMGMRLDGPRLDFAPGRTQDMTSEGVVAGVIQVAGDGQPIVLLPDGQTTGGYPRIATVIGADQSRLATRLPGDPVRFAPVTLSEAEAAARAAAYRLSRAIAEPIARDETSGPGAGTGRP